VRPYILLVSTFLTPKLMDQDRPKRTPVIFVPSVGALKLRPYSAIQICLLLLLIPEKSQKFPPPVAYFLQGGGKKSQNFGPNFDTTCLWSSVISNQRTFWTSKKLVKDRWWLCLMVPTGWGWIPQLWELFATFFDPKWAPKSKRVISL